MSDWSIYISMLVLPCPWSLNNTSMQSSLFFHSTLFYIYSDFKDRFLTRKERMCVLPFELACLIHLSNNIKYSGSSMICTVWSVRTRVWASYYYECLRDIIWNLVLISFDVPRVFCRHGLHISGEEPKSMVWKKTLLKSGCTFGPTAVASHWLPMMPWMVYLSSLSLKLVSILIGILDC